MQFETILFFIASVFIIYYTLKLLEGLFKAAMKLLNKVGAFVVAILPAVIVITLGTFLFGVGNAEAAAMGLTTEVVVGAIASSMFGE